MASSTGTDGTRAARGRVLVVFVFTKSDVLLYTYYFIHIFRQKKRGGRSIISVEIELFCLLYARY